jgi:hypothetical protein
MISQLRTRTASSRLPKIRASTFIRYSSQTRSLRNIFIMGSVVIPHLNSGWHVDQAILSDEERLVVIRFGRSTGSLEKTPLALPQLRTLTGLGFLGRDWDQECMKQDEVLYKIADKVKSFAVIYVCDIDQVPDFNQMYGMSTLSFYTLLSLGNLHAGRRQR